MRVGKYMHLHEQLLMSPFLRVDVNIFPAVGSCGFKCFALAVSCECNQWIKETIQNTTIFIFTISVSRVCVQAAVIWKSGVALQILLAGGKSQQLNSDWVSSHWSGSCRGNAWASFLLSLFSGWSALQSPLEELLLWWWHLGAGGPFRGLSRGPLNF